MNKGNQSRVSLLTFFLIGMVALTASGLLFKLIFVIYNFSQFSAMSFSDISYALFWGLRFDLASAALLTLLGCLVLWLIQRLLPKNNPAYFLIALLMFTQMSLQIGDTVYFVEAGRHVSYEMRDVFVDASGLFMTAITKHSGFIIGCYILTLVIIVFLLRQIKRTGFLVTRKSLLPDFMFKPEASLVLVILLSVVIVRGGFTGLPQSVISAFKIGDAQQAIITMNGAYSVVYGAINSRKEISRLNIALPEGIETGAVMKQLYPVLPDFSESGKPVKKYNIVFILMEGWPADMMSAYGYAIETTPFYASLKEKSIAPLGAIAGGVRTTEGIYATFCSQQNPLGKTVAQTSLQNNSYDCLPDILKRQGWHTAFFQGSHKETSGTGAFAQSLGFSESFAKEDLPPGRYKHNYWGAHDPDIYDFVLDKLDDMPQPFLIGVNTNSTHDVRMPEGVKPEFTGDSRSQKYQGILRFADDSMRAFFEKIKQKAYYANTLFVLMSDHTGGKHKTTAARYFIPAIIYGEKLVPAAKINRYISQRDLSPTVLDILGLSASPSFAGKSFWREIEYAGGDTTGRMDELASSLASNRSEPHFADYFHAGTVGWVSDGMLVETSIADPMEMKCYNLERGLLHASTADCDKVYKKRSIDSLVFTSYSQQLLFDGKTKTFYGFYDR